MINEENIRPINDNVLVRLIPYQGERITLAHEERPFNEDVTARILAVGNKCSDRIKVGDVVKIESFSGYIPVDAHLWVKEKHIMGGC